MATSTPHHKFSLHGEHSYLRIAVFSGDQWTVPVEDIKSLKFAINDTLKTAFGVVGASACDFDILSFEQGGREPPSALLRVQRNGLETLWGAITMCSSINSKLCRLEVVHSGDSLIDMAAGRFL